MFIVLDEVIHCDTTLTTDTQGYIFTNDILKNSVNIDPKISKIINENFSKLF